MCNIVRSCRLDAGESDVGKVANIMCAIAVPVAAQVGHFQRIPSLSPILAAI